MKQLIAKGTIIDNDTNILKGFQELTRRVQEAANAEGQLRVEGEPSTDSKKSSSDD